MTPSEYIKLALRTESPYIIDDLPIEASRLLHGAMGCCTESGELLDDLKKYLFYKKPLDKVNIKEEIGDLFWYIAILCDELEVSFEKVMEANIAKLKARYPEKFTTEKAINRDLDKERDILEGKNIQ